MEAQPSLTGLVLLFALPSDESLGYFRTSLRDVLKLSIKGQIINYKVKPIPFAIAFEVRETFLSPQYKSLKAAISVADGSGPCRSCLRVFDQGRENRLFFTYNSFDGRADLPDPGPVFIHHDECNEFAGAGIPTDLLDLPILFEAFGDKSILISREAMAPDADEQINSTFANEEVRFINMRNAEAGCFIATIERV